MELDLIRAYENYLTKVKKASGNTVSSYMRDIRQFAAWLADTEGADIVDATQLHIGAYLEHLSSENRSSATRSRVLASLKNFFSYLVSNGFVNESPVKDVKVERSEKKPPQFLTSREVELLLAQPSSQDAKGIRDKAMLELMYATGIRVTELIELDLEHVNLENSTIKCVGSKKTRVIPLYPEALKALTAYLRDVRSALVADAREKALFVNVSGSRMSRQGFWKILKHYQTTAHIDKEIGPHTLRHSFAVHLLENGAEIEAVQEMMGHSDVSSTQVYSSLVDQRLKQVYARCHPKA